MIEAIFYLVEHKTQMPAGAAVWWYLTIFDILLFQYKLCKVVRQCTGPKGVPYVATHDGRTIRYPDPLIKVNDSIQVDIQTGKILDFIKFESGKFLFSSIGMGVLNPCWV